MELGYVSLRILNIDSTRSQVLKFLLCVCLGNNPEYLLDRSLIVDMKLVAKVAILLLQGIG